MKRLLLPVLLAFSGASVTPVLAQPTLTSAGNNLTVGAKFPVMQTTITATEFAAAATAGANQSWNFGALTSSGSIQAGVLSRAAGPNPTSLPAANLVVRAGDEYVYIESSATSLKEHGAYQAAQNYSLENTDPAEKMRFPFTFNNTFTDAYSGVANLGTNVIPRIGNVTVTAEGYGTLITPNGTFQNVLKVKTEEISNPQTPFSEISITYDWFQPGVAFPLLRMTRRTTLLGIVHSGLYLNQPVGTNEELAASLNLQLFPNPATAELTIQFKTEGAEKVKLSLLNVIGQEISALPYPEAGLLKTLKVDVSKFPAGIYLLNVQTDAGAFTKRVIIE